MERKIGEIFRFDKRRFIVQKAVDRKCTDCAMNQIDYAQIEDDAACKKVGECEDIFRTDDTDIIAKEV